MRNLRDKIRALVGDAYDLRMESVVTRIENLVKDELALRDEERQINFQDLNLIQSDAVGEFTRIRMDQDSLGRIAGDDALVRTLCVVNATVSFLRSKGHTTAILRYKK